MREPTCFRCTVLPPGIRPTDSFRATDLRDFTPVILVAKSASALVVHPAIPVKNLKEFVALAKARSGKQNYNWNAVPVPAKTPASIVGKLHGLLAAAIRDNREMFVGQGQEPGGEGGEALTAFIHAETERYETVAREAHIPRQ